jgi:hypothetical protein
MLKLQLCILQYRNLSKTCFIVIAKFKDFGCSYSYILTETLIKLMAEFLKILGSYSAELFFVIVI